MAKIFDFGAYRDILRVRAAYAFDIGCFLMRFLPYMANIGVVSMLTLAGHSFLTAGIVSSVIALASFLISPWVSRLIDERGQSRIIPGATLVAMVGLAILLLSVALEWPFWLMCAGAVLLGFMPSSMALCRTRWTYLIRTGKLEGKAPSLKTMFSYEGVLDDVGFMFAPPLSIMLSASITPIAGLLVGGIAFVVGAVITCLSKSTEPEPGWEAEDSASEVDVSPELEGEGHSASAKTDVSHGSEESRLVNDGLLFRKYPVIIVMFVQMLFLGAFFGVFDTTTVALAEEVGSPDFASLVLMVAGFISMVAGFVFGMVRLRMPQYLQLVWAAILIGVSYGAMVFIDSPLSLFIVSTIAAPFYAPFVIICNASCEQAVPGRRLTEAITWINAGVRGGMAAGPSIGGIVIDSLGTMIAFDIGAVLAIAIPIVTLCCVRLLKREVSSSD